MGLSFGGSLVLIDVPPLPATAPTPDTSSVGTLNPPSLVGYDDFLRIPGQVAAHMQVDQPEISGFSDWEVRLELPGAALCAASELHAPRFFDAKCGRQIFV